MFEHIPVTLTFQNTLAAPPPSPPPNQNGQPLVPVDTNGTNTAPTDTGTGTGLLGGFFPLLIIFGILILFIVMTSGQQRKERKRREAMLAAIKKGDRIQTVGGIRGTLVEVRDDEVIVKVDENANTRLRFARSAIQNLLEDDADKV